jgi:hypothetical protein
VDRFVDLIEQLSAYTANPNHLFYTTCFIDGLRADIHAIILVQHPQDLDTACTLALLQEEAIEPGQRREFHKTDGSPFAKPQASKGALPLPPPPARAAVRPPIDDKKPTEDRRFPPKTTIVEDKF